MDWSSCIEVGQVPGKVSGAPILTNTPVQADAIVMNGADYSPAEVADMFDVPIEQVQAVLDYASLNREALHQHTAGSYRPKTDHPLASGLEIIATSITRSRTDAAI